LSERNEELRSNLETQHAGAMSVVRHRAQTLMVQGKNDKEVWEAIRIPAVRANAILMVAYNLGVVLDRPRVTEDVMSTWRIPLMKH
jgi:hypothetical protein